MYRITPHSMSFISMLSALPKMDMAYSAHIVQKYSSMANLCQSISDNKESHLENIHIHLTSDSIHYLTMLTQIPGVDVIKASKISDYFPTMSDLCSSFQQSSSLMLSSIVGSDNLSKRIYNYLFNDEKEKEFTNDKISMSGS